MSFGEESPKLRRYIIMASVAVVVIVAILFVWGAVAKTIPAGNRGVLLTFGAVDTSRVLGEGIQFVNPLFGQNVAVVNVQTQKITEKASAASKDLQDVSTTIAINYRIEPEHVNVLYRDLGVAYAEKVVAPISQEAIKQVTAQYSAEQLITQRETVKQKIQDVLVNKLTPYDILVTQVSITDFAFSQSFNNAIDQKATAVQDALKASNILQKIKIEATQKIATAEGLRNSTIAIAEGTGKAKVLEAAGTAQAISLVNDALSKSPLYLQYLKISTWNGKLPTVMGGGEGQIIALPQDLISSVDVPTNITNATK